MIAGWLAPLLTWSGLSILEIIGLIIIIVLIIKKGA